MKKPLILLILISMIAFFSCASEPETADSAKEKALAAQEKALAIEADTHVPSRYGEALSQLQMAEEKEAAGSIEEAIDLYQKAEVSFNVAHAETEKKLRVDAYYIEEVNPLVDDVENRINS